MSLLERASAALALLEGVPVGCDVSPKRTGAPSVLLRSRKTRQVSAEVFCSLFNENKSLTKLRSCLGAVIEGDQCVRFSTQALVNTTAPSSIGVRACLQPRHFRCSVCAFWVIEDSRLTVFQECFNLLPHMAMAYSLDRLFPFNCRRSEGRRK